jgi:integrase
MPSRLTGQGDGGPRRVNRLLVFPGERGTPFSGWSKAKSALDAASGVSGWWLHDLRRTLATGLQPRRVVSSGSSTRRNIALTTRPLGLEQPSPHDALPISSCSRGCGVLRLI